METTKRNALFSYKGFKEYQPLNTSWAEQGLVLHTEFRDGNVPAGYVQLQVFQEALVLLLESADKARLRSDTVGYQHELLRYCAKRVTTIDVKEQKLELFLDKTQVDEFNYRLD